MVALIERKRDGGELSPAEVAWFIEAYTAGKIPDYQVSAMLMAIYLQGMNRRETVNLTLAMARSGDQLDLHDVAPFVVDKHSSGGVGDKTTLVVQPLVAACGVPVGKMSGRGLGSSGGTLDKMDSFTGWSCSMSLARFKRQLAETGCVLAGQTADLAPADGKLYALRDVTGTVGSIPLIAGSIMSKKLAAGADAIVLDVKTGNGAFMQTVEMARELAQIMVDIGNDAGRKTVAVLSDMNQPLGHAVGNALEVKEALDTLAGQGPPDFREHCLVIAGHMLQLAGVASTETAARTMVAAALDEGEALAKFRQMVAAQGGDIKQVDQPHTLPQAPYQETVRAPQAAHVAAIDAGAIGWAAVRLGAGRLVKTDKIDHAVGFILPFKVGQAVVADEPLFTIHAADKEKLVIARDAILDAISWSDNPVDPLPHFHGIIT